VAARQARKRNAQNFSPTQLNFFALDFVRSIRLDVEELKMQNTPSILAKRLKYKIPRIRLCLVQDAFEESDMYFVRTPHDAAQFLEPLRHAPEENFVSIHLNSRHQVIGVHEVSHGTLSTSLVHPREVFKAALLANSYAILVCHNHPSGSTASPSQEDLETTDQLLKAGKILGVNVVDHLIMSPIQGVYSLRENYPEIWGE
jgi:DNA repair protein RadC